MSSHDTNAVSYSDSTEPRNITDAIEDGDSTDLETPIKVEWSGKARSKIKGHCLDADNPRAELFVEATNRLKTRLVCHTAEEAAAVLSQLSRYGPGRSWLTPVQSRTLRRVESEIVDALEERRFDVVETDRGLFTVYEQPLVADGGFPTCDSCGERVTETIAGPGEARRSCGCPFVPDFDVPDDTENALSNVAIRALVADGDVETAAEIHEATRGQLVTDGGEVKGTLILATNFGQSPTWHHSVAFDGDSHTTACGSSIDCSAVDEVELEVPSSVLQEGDRVCPTCEESVADHEEQLIADGGRDLQDIGTVVSSTQFEGDRFALETSNAAVTFEFMTPALARATAETILPDGYEVVEEEPLTDGGVPESFDDLASTCESCGDDVEPERLIEGECPGCHYHEPVADGGAAEPENGGEDE